MNNPISCNNSGIHPFDNHEYYIGLDLGTNSVGWAVTNTRYNLIKAPVKGKKKNYFMWGIRLFPEANTAADRRLERCNRRKNRRKVNRIKLLQELFAEEINEVDPTFFQRLNESRLHLEDKTNKDAEFKHPLFIESDNAEKEYYEKYPTIFHLRSELIHNKEPHDIRLIYLACHHIIKNRGHFLRDGDIGDAINFKSIINELITSFCEYGITLTIDSIDKVKEILSNQSINNTTKKKLLTPLFDINVTDDSDITEKNKKKIIEHICIFMVGNKGNVTNIFSETSEVEDLKTFKMSEEKYEDEIKPLLLSDFPSVVDCLDAIKSVYDWTVLQQILPEGVNYLSDAKIESYNKHAANLKILKVLTKEHLGQPIYSEFFRNVSKKPNYTSYIGFSDRNNKVISTKKCSDEDDFYTSLQKNIINPLTDSLKTTENLNGILDKFKDSDTKTLVENFWNKENIKTIEDLANYLSLEVENCSLLPVQRSKDNSVIPRQIHQKELNIILENAKEYLPFLNETDESATSIEEKTTAGKIKSIFAFKIPYYVGPLSNKNANLESNGTYAHQWMVRKSDGYIYPWNFNEMVDLEESNHKFIRRMTNKCSYLIGEDVLPKNSLLYKKYTLLNELNNLKLFSEPISIELKKDIYNDLFLYTKNKNVTGKILVNYLKQKSGFEDISLHDISGIDKNFANNLSSYKDFKKILNHDLNDEESNAAEQIIKWITIYDDDSNMVYKAIKRDYSNLFTEDQINKISKLKYKGWGNFSKKFLTSVKTGIPELNGREASIIEAMWDTNNNLMQLLSSRYSFIENIDETNSIIQSDNNAFTYDNVVKELFTSPANKRTIWQALLIVKEIYEVMGYPPSKIFIEMARGNKYEKKRTDSRKQKLIELYKNCDNDVRIWSDELSKKSILENLNKKEVRELNSKKLYLYYLQGGKCAYSGETINLDELMRGNSKWDIDHIYPQSKIKDDSFNNLVLVKKEINEKKSNEIMPSEIQKNMSHVWDAWQKNGFITKDKLNRLKRSTPFTDDELAGFIERQLVETRQSSKLVTDLLKQMFSSTKTKIVYVKASLVSEFRHYPLNVYKSRRANDFHHAKDAYLNIVVGNVYNSKYTDNPHKWIKENRGTNYSINKTMCFDVKDAQGNIVWYGCDRDPITNKFIMVDDDYIDGQINISGGDIDIVRATVRIDSCLYTEMTWEESGELFYASKKKKGSKSATLPLKKDLPIERYGGYYSASIAYFVAIQCISLKGKDARMILGVPIHIANQAKNNDNAIADYFTNQGYKDVKVLKKILKNSLLDIMDNKLRIRRDNKYQIFYKNNSQPKFPPSYQETIRKIEKVIDKDNNTITKEHDKLTTEELILVFDFLINELENGYYSKRIANPVHKILQLRNNYLSLNDIEKCYIINEILNMFRCDVSNIANIKKIKGGTEVGNIAINKNTVSTQKITLINQSVTGLFENRTII